MVCAIYRLALPNYVFPCQIPLNIVHSNSFSELVHTTCEFHQISHGRRSKSGTKYAERSLLCQNPQLAQCFVMLYANVLSTPCFKLMQSKLIIKHSKRRSLCHLRSIYAGCILISNCTYAKVSKTQPWCST